MLVMKFGGTSVGSAERMEQIIELISKKNGKQPPVVVLSAMSGVTNLLIEGAEVALKRDMPAAQKNIDAIQDKHHKAINTLFNEESVRQ